MIMMSDNIYTEITGMIMTIITFYMISYFLSKMLTPKKDNKFYVWKYFIPITVENYVCKFNYFLFENKAFIVCITLIILPFLFSKDKWQRKLLVPLSWIIANFLINLLNNWFCMVKFDITIDEMNTLPIEELLPRMMEGNSVLCSQAFSYTFLALFEMTLILLSNKRLKNRLEIFFIDLFTFILVTLSTIPAYFLIDGSEPIVLIISLVAYISSIFLMIYTFSKINFYQEYYESIAENKYLKEKEQMQLEYYKSVQEKEEEIRKINHDIKNNLQVIYSLKNDEDKKKFITKIDNNLNKHEIKKYSSNDILNIVLNTKVIEASKENIDIDLKVKCSLEFMEELDMSNLFSNILDNAIEGCRKSKDKKIKLIIRSKMNLYYIKCSNSFEGEVKRDSSKKIITKKNGYHGYGLNIIKNITEKYHGELNINNDNNSFTITIIIPKVED